MYMAGEAGAQLPYSSASYAAGTQAVFSPEDKAVTVLNMVGQKRASVAHDGDKF